MKHGAKKDLFPRRSIYKDVQKLYRTPKLRGAGRLSLQNVVRTVDLKSSLLSLLFALDTSYKTGLKNYSRLSKQLLNLMIVWLQIIQRPNYGTVKTIHIQP